MATLFIDHSSEMWNFRCDRLLEPLSLLHEKGDAMRKTLMALAAAATLAVTALAAPAPAQAQRGVAAGVAAGLLGGAIVGGAIASQNGYYGPGYYGPGYGYGGPAYVADPDMMFLCLAAPALLGRLWLAGSPRQSLRLSPFTFITN